MNEPATPDSRLGEEEEVEQVLAEARDFALAEARGRAARRARGQSQLLPAMRQLIGVIRTADARRSGRRTRPHDAREGTGSR